MRKHTGIRRVLSIVLSMALVFSAMAVVGVSAESSVWGFETDAIGTNISLSETYTAVPTDAVAYSGSRSLQLSAGKKAAASRPQIMLKDGNGAEIAVVEGGVYNISFYAMMPEGSPDRRILYWLTATDSTVAYTATDDKNTELFYEPSGAISTTLGTWYKVEITGVTAPRSGKLRLGLSGNSNSAHTVYLDDVLVETVSEPTPTPTPTPSPSTAEWGFESEVLGTNLSLSETYTAVPTDAAAHGGSRSLQLSAGKKAAVSRPQIMLKDNSGAQIAVVEGGVYNLSFYVMMPEGSPDRRILYWLTATDSTTAYTDSNDKNTELFYEPSGAISTTLGTWYKVEITGVTAPRSGALRLGLSGNSNSAHTVYLDDVSFETVSLPTPPPATPTAEWSFETEAKDTELSLNAAAGYSAKVTDAAKNSGNQALLISGSKKAATSRPQIMIKNGSGEQIMITEGNDYNISFYVMFPDDALSADSQKRYSYWLTATDSTVAYTATNEKDAELFYESGLVKCTEYGVWHKIEINGVTATRSGALRLGISGNVNAAHTFYIDDILVEEILPPPPTTGPWSFEHEEVGTALDLNTNACTITVSDEITPQTGAHVAKVTSVAKSGNGRPQMIVRDAAGNKIQVYKGRSYEFKFNVFMPESINDLNFSYWLAATKEEKPFSGSYAKDSYVIAEVSGGTQPTKGEWVEVTLLVADCPHTGLLRFGLTGDTNEQHSFYIDNLSVTETVLDYDMDVQSFEIYSDGDTLSLGNNAITATTEDAHAGEYAAKVVTAGNSIDGAPQMLVTDAAGETVTVQKDAKYNVSFYVCVPADAADTDIRYWLTAGDETPFSDSNPRTGIVVDTQTLTVTDKGSWQYVLLTIDGCAASGKLRLGITGTTAESLTFYVDDIFVEERLAGATDTEAMNFENYAVGENLSLTTSATETMTVTNLESYTGLQSVFVKSSTRAGDNRPQLPVLDGDGNQVKLEKGEDYYLSFMVLIPEGQDYFDLSYWAACVPDDKVNDPFVQNSEFLKNDYVVAEVSQHLAPTLGEWVQIKLPIIDCKYSGNLRFGITHHTQGVKSEMYVDDIKVVPPQYILVKFDTNGSEDVYEDVLVLADSLIPYSGVDPYLFGYEFMGWYTDESFGREYFFDIGTTPVTGVTGDVITLYARWREWDKVVVDLGDRDEEQQFKTEYYTEKVWVGDQNVADPLDIGERPAHKDAAPIVVTPDEVQPDADGIPPWLIVVIIIAAVVVVGGGAAIAAILLKKKKA